MACYVINNRCNKRFFELNYENISAKIEISFKCMVLLPYHEMLTHQINKLNKCINKVRLLKMYFMWT